MSTIAVPMAGKTMINNAIVQAFSGDDTKEDFAIEIAADCPEELDEMWDELKRDIRRMIRYITIENPDHK